MKVSKKRSFVSTINIQRKQLAFGAVTLVEEGSPLVVDELAETSFDDYNKLFCVFHPLLERFLHFLGMPLRGNSFLLLALHEVEKEA